MVTHRPYFRWTAIAASLLLVVSLSWYFLLKKQKAGITPVATVATVAITKVFPNNTPRKMPLTLSDGSTAELSPGSTLSYPETFNSSKRDVRLKGDATFTIAKDAAKPFYVYSNSIFITVLGTRFTVISDEADQATKVILHEGRIMVRFSDSSSGDDKAAYYLAPGDILIVKNAKKPAGLSARVLHLEKDRTDRYVFDNYPLDVVFDQLQIIYNAKIIYNKATLGNRSFIGKIDKKDSLYQLLKSIALLNNFRLQKQGDSFTIGY